MREIGSEFSFSTVLHEAQNYRDWLPKAEDFAFVFSGRTAIETAVNDIRTEKKKAFLPAYCCSSMIEPFIKYDIEVDFYNISTRGTVEAKFEIPSDCQVLLWCNYFGYKAEYPQKEIDAFKKRGGIVIEDITHSLFSSRQAHDESMYLVASLRKWDGLICGGLVAKRSGRFKSKGFVPPSNEYITEKEKAMQMKEAYLRGEKNAEKEEYLKGFSACNAWLSDNYTGRAIDEKTMQVLRSWDIEQIKKKRIENASFLHESLKNVPELRFMFPKSAIDCPLFVPILLSEKRRKILHQMLIKKQIYCPMHWPKPNDACHSELYETEISLICDQRYSVDDMKRIADIIKSM